MDHATGKHRGFGFIEYEVKDDAAAAIENMHNAELFGRVLKANYAQPMKIKGGDKGWSHQPVSALRLVHHVARMQLTAFVVFVFLLDQNQNKGS
jgi:RNA recognition motif-containing protein